MKSENNLIKGSLFQIYHKSSHARPNQSAKVIGTPYIKACLGPNIVISPSHEEIFPNVSVENIKAIMDAARQ